MDDALRYLVLLGDSQQRLHVSLENFAFLVLEAMGLVRLRNLTDGNGGLG
jgi:hypothetical protein